MAETREAAGDEIFGVRGAFTFFPYPSLFSLFILPRGEKQTKTRLEFQSVALKGWKSFMQSGWA